jgi:type II secretory pathway component PulC
MNCTVLWDRNFGLTVTWKKDNVDIYPDGKKFVREADNALTIKNLDFDDGGKMKTIFCSLRG